MITFNTDRLKFRKEEVTDINSIYEMLCDPEVGKFRGGVTKKSIEEIKEIIAENSNKFSVKTDDIAKGKGHCTFGVFDIDTDEFMGSCGLKFCKPMNEVELWYLFRRPFWGKGFGYESANAVLRFGFEKMGLPAIYAAVDPENTASEIILKKIGMNYIKMVVWPDNKMLKMYGIRKYEFNTSEI